MRSFGSLHRGWLWVGAAALWVAALAAPLRGGAEELEVADVMAGIEKAYSELVKSLMLVPVQKLVDETPFGEIEKRAGEIAENARRLPEAGDFKEDETFHDFARRLRGLAQRLKNFAKEKRLEASTSALLQLQRACLRCHGEYRF